MRIRTRDSIFVGVAILLASIASGCSLATPSQPPTAALAPIPRPVAPPQAPGSAQTVKASYYGDEFRGHRTASGERYDPNQLTAASKRLPIGSLVHVTNPENGLSVVVRINDHGPYVRGAQSRFVQGGRTQARTDSQGRRPGKDRPDSFAATVRACRIAGRGEVSRAQCSSCAIEANRARRCSSERAIEVSRSLHFAASAIRVGRCCAIRPRLPRATGCSYGLTDALESNTPHQSRGEKTVEAAAIGPGLHIAIVID
jgi:hypothetical protein